MKLDNCKFVAIDEIDDIYKQDEENLSKLLKIITDSPSKLITCSATMEKRFLEFYGKIDENYIQLNLNAELEK